jgi:lipooligosaccharide transport system ATP-binding protein
VFASFFSIDKKTARDRSIELLKMVRLDDVIDKSVDQLSGGMKRRLVIARSLINHPDLVILDEPTVGLDPQIRMWVWDFLQKIKSQGTTMILTTHYMEEAESLCDRLAILDKGKLLAVGSPKELIETQLAENILEFEIDPTEMQYYLNRIKTQGFKYFVVGRQVFVSYPQADQSNSILAMVNSRKISIRKTSLSDVFLSLAGHDLKEF